MGIFERVLQERPAAPEGLSLTPKEAFAALVLAAFHSDGRFAPEGMRRLNEVFNSTRLFRQPPVEPPRAVLDRVVELYDTHGFAPVVAAAANALPNEMRTPVFAIAVDLVMADGQASAEERQFIDGLQALMRVPEDAALKIAEVIVLKNSV